MRVSNWLRPLTARVNPVRRRSLRPRPAFRLRVETLEDRIAPAVFLVTNTGDNGGVNPAAFAGTGTLRQAIIDANATPGADTIQFALPDSLKGPGGWWTIQPQSALPTITDPVTIDGWSQAGAGPGLAPEVMIDGTDAGSARGLDINYNCTVRGLAIGNFSAGAGIALEDGGNTVQGCYLGIDPTGTTAAPNVAGVGDTGVGNIIGGTNPGEGNVISGNGFADVQSRGYSVTICGNLIGTDATGTAALSNSDGISLGFVPLDGSPSVIEDNLISGHRGSGILLQQISHVRIRGNLIGTDVTGMHALGNLGSSSAGIWVLGGATDIVIGGTDLGSRNVISANGHFGGIRIESPGVVVQGNYIGTDVTGTTLLGNRGAGISTGGNGCEIGGPEPGAGNLIAGNGADDYSGISLGSSNNLVQGNVIRDNYGAGIYIGAFGLGTGNTVSQNAIYGNIPDPFVNTSPGSGLGIDILDDSDNGGVTLNDSLGHDGPNHFQNYPVLTGVTYTASGITVTGTLTQSVTPNTSFRIEFFANTQEGHLGPDGFYYGEGKRFLGSVDVVTDASGNAPITASLPALLAGEEFLTATATNLATGDTSEFSKDEGLAVATLTSSATPSLFGQPVTFTATVSALAGAATPTGSVDFVDRTTNTDLGTVALSGGTASVTTSSLAGGTHVIEAIYGGDGTFLGTSGSFTQSVAEYTFRGFLPPLSNGLAFAVNRSIPVKFQLTDTNGNAVTSLNAITSLQIQALDANGNPVGAPFAPVSSNNQGLQYNGGQYLINWQTKNVSAGSYEIVLKLNDGTTHYSKPIQLTAGGSAAGLVTGSSGGTATAGALLGGEVDLYVDNSNGDLTSDELARIQDAVNAVDATIAPYGVVITEVSDPTQANVTLNMNPTSALGGVTQGVLGCTTDADQVTMIQGWGWYAGSDPTQIGAGQYDFETAVMHELGHVLGLGHSSSSTSVMYATLATGISNRALVAADLNVPDSDSGPCALHAAPAVTGNGTSIGPGLSAPSSLSVPASGSSSSGVNPLFAELDGFLSHAWNAYQSEWSSLSALWQQVDALALQRLDTLWSLEAGAMGVSKDTLRRDLLFASNWSPNG
jgi:hypothetical protein